MIPCVIFLLAYLAGVSHAQDCSVNSRCQHFIQKVPECKTNPREDDLAKCISSMLADCHSQTQAAQQMHDAILANEVICDNPSLAKDFENNPKCWIGLQTCKISFGDVRNRVSGASTEDKEKVCIDTRQNFENCKSRLDINEGCKDMEINFLEKAFEKSTCGCCTLALQLSVLLVSVLLAAFGRLA